MKLTDASAFFLGDLSDAAALKRAAAAYVGGEKDGVHRIILSNPNVVDVEVAFGLEANGEVPPSSRRVDFAALRLTAEGVEIVFYEAKRSNKELRANGDTHPPVAEQIDDYGKLLREHSPDVRRSYRKVCGNLIDLCGVRERYEDWRETMRRLSANEIDLGVSDDVRLVVFGFDADQRDGMVWKKHREKLKVAINQSLLLTGNPQGFTRGISAPL